MHRIIVTVPITDSFGIELPLMEHAPAENSQHSAFSTSIADHHLEDKSSHLSNHKGTEPKSDITFEEIISIMEVIAVTGRFWHDWNILKNLLSFRLKQVLAEYPEAKVVSGDGPQQSPSSGETYTGLVRRLDEALLSFIEGPPFTLQRLCEILLAPKSTYRSLSKLALALEKNLLVTSTLTICTHPYPRPVSPKPAEPERVMEESQVHSFPVSNGLETRAGDGDEEMVEAEADEDAPSSDTEVHEAQVVDTEVHEAQVVDTEVHEAQVVDTEVHEAQVVDTEVHEAQVVDTEIDAQVADTEVHNAQVTDTEVHHPQNAETEAHDTQNVDTEMQEEKASEAPESNPDQRSDSSSLKEPCTTIGQNPPTPEQP